MTKLADPTFHQTASGMELELHWSKDESVVTLSVWRDKLGAMPKKRVVIMLTPTQLDELREFIADNLQ